MIRRFLDPVEYRAAIAPLLTADPARSTILTTVVDGLVAAPTAGFVPLLLAALAGERVVGACLQTPPYPVSCLIGPRAPGGDDPAIGLGRAVAAAKAALPGFNGPRDDARAVAAAWTAATRHDVSVRTEMLLYRMGTFRPPRPVAGRPRAADPMRSADLDLVARWRNEFALAALPRGPEAEAPDPAAVLRYHRAGGVTTLWCDAAGRPVSLAASSPVIGGTCRVGPVYTPEPDRRRGYGAAVTAAAVVSCRARGATEIVLFTDLANATSNAVYRRLGFEPVEEFVELAVT